MRKPKISFAVALGSFLTLLTCSQAQTSVWWGMAVAGEFTGWVTTPNMTLVSNNTWQVDLFVGTPSNRFKFAANNGWGNNWGDNDQPTRVPPVIGTADKFGHDVTLTNLPSGYYRFLFNDATLYYKVEILTRCNYRSMGVAGDLNNWSPLANMTLVSNNTWRAMFFINPAYANGLKFVPNGVWGGIEWGELNQTATNFPLTGIAELNPGYEKNINFPSGPHYGNYIFTFNDSNLSYRIEPQFLASHQSMAFVGTANGWNPWPNMTLVTNYVWKRTMSLSDQNMLFKFTANNGWVSQWGTTNQTMVEVPLYAVGVRTNGEGNDFVMNNIESGTYTIYFYETNGLCQILPEGFLQDFDSWATKGSYAGTFMTNDWIVGTGIINNANSRYGQCIRLNYDTEEGHYVRTPFFSNGVQEISFWYRSWSVSPAMTYEIQSSTDGLNWRTNDTLSGISTTNYLRYRKTISETNGVYIRLFHVAGKERLLIDDFMMIEPYASAWIGNVTLQPANPWTNDAVTVSAQIGTNAFTSNLQVRLYYQTISNGAFSIIGMTPGVSNFYNTTNSIPRQPGGTKVSYYLDATFSGRGGSNAVYWPNDGSNSPAFYYIPQNKPGAVWINELNYEPIPFITDDTNEFVELCGASGVNISGWRIELLDERAPMSDPYATYIIANGTTLYLDNTNGFGFFVLGDAGLPGVNMVLTNTPEGGVGNSHIKDGRGAIRLLNEIGGVECAISYGEATNNYGFQYAGAIPFDWDYDYCLTLAGSGASYTGFVWTTSTFLTVHSANPGQNLYGGNTNASPQPEGEPVVYCVNMQFGTNIVIITSGNTNTPPWNVAPYYMEDLRNAPQQWTAVSSVNSTFANGTNTIRFSPPSGALGFYRVLLNKP